MQGHNFMGPSDPQQTHIDKQGDGHFYMTLEKRVGEA